MILLPQLEIYPRLNSKSSLLQVLSLILPPPNSDFTWEAFLDYKTVAALSLWTVLYGAGPSLKGFLYPQTSVQGQDRYATNCHLSDLSWGMITAQHLTRDQSSTSNLTHTQSCSLRRPYSGLAGNTCPVLRKW